MPNSSMEYLASIKSIFGDSAELTGEGADAVLTFKPAETGQSNFTNPERARPEALLLALLQKAFDTQCITPTRAMEVTKTAILATKTPGQVTGEQYIVRIFAGTAFEGISPDMV
jgi:hypothetical protein